MVFKDFMESVLVLGAPVEGRLLLIFSLSASACSKGLEASAPDNTELVSGRHRHQMNLSQFLCYSSGIGTLCLTTSVAPLTGHHQACFQSCNMRRPQGVGPHLVGLPTLCGLDTVLHASRLCLKTQEA